MTFIICNVFLLQICRCKLLPIDTGGWFTHNVNDSFSRVEQLGFRVLNLLMMDYKGDGDVLSLNRYNIGNSLGLQILTLLVSGSAPQDLADQLTPP